MGFTSPEEIKADNKALFGLLTIGTVIMAVMFTTMKTGGNTGVAWGYYNSPFNPTEAAARAANAEADAGYYRLAQQMAFMVVMGFGFFSMFLKNYGFSAIGFGLLLIVQTIQQSFLWQALIMGSDNYNGVYLAIGNNPQIQGQTGGTPVTLIDALYCLAATMIVFSVCMGKLTPFQTALVNFFMVPLFWANIRVADQIGGWDLAGTMFVSGFAAVFGLSVSYMVSSQAVHDHDNIASSYSCDRISFIGTVIMFIFFPSFNAARALAGPGMNTAILNTATALIGGVLGYCIFSATNTSHQLDFPKLQSASIAGGVAIAAIADFPISATGAGIIGVVAGICSTLAAKYLQPLLAKFRMYDSCGAGITIHLSSAWVGAIASAIVIATAKDNVRQNALVSTQVANYWSKSDFLNRDAGELFGYQLAIWATTIGLATVGGLIVGALINFLGHHIAHVSDEGQFHDEEFWHFENIDGKPVVARPHHDKAAAETEADSDDSKA